MRQIIKFPKWTEKYMERYSIKIFTTQIKIAIVDGSKTKNYQGGDSLMAKKDTKLVQLSKIVSEMADDLRIEGLDMEFFDVFEEKAENLTDSRQQSKVKHKMEDVIAIVFFALLAGEDEWIEIEYFAIDQRDVLKKYLKLPNGIPSHDTLERVISIIEPDELQDFLVDTLRAVIMRATKEMDMPLYTNEELGIRVSDIVAIDGKETCSTGNPKADNEQDRRNLNELNVQSTEYGITLSSTRIDEKTNEIPETQKVLKKLDLRGCIVTADALNTQKETARSIVKDAHADYCLALKANQKNAYTDVVEYFQSSDIRKELCSQKNSWRKEKEIFTDKTVEREYYISDDIKWFSDKKLWTGLKSIGYEKKKIKKADGETVVEERYFLCSFHADAELFSIVVRRHRHIENLLHWVLDVTFKEDRLSTREKKALHNIGLIRRFVLSLLKILKEYYGNISYKQIRRRIGRTFEKQVPVIFSVIKELYDQGNDMK